MALLRYGQAFKEGKITIGNRYSDCALCHKTTEGKVVIIARDKSFNEVYICEDCIKDVCKVLDKGVNDGLK